jgi:hypothetical protein
MNWRAQEIVIEMLRPRFSADWSLTVWTLWRPLHTVGDDPRF